MEVKFDAADKDILVGQKEGSVIMKTIRKNGPPGTIVTQQPRGSFSPIIVKPSSIGFFHPRRPYEGTQVSNCDIGTCAAGGKVIFGQNRIENICHLEIATEEA